MNESDAEFEALRGFLSVMVERERAKIDTSFARLIAETYADIAGNLILYGQPTPPDLSPQMAAQVWAQAQRPSAPTGDYRWLSLRL